MSEPTNMTAPPPLPKDVDDAIHRLTDAHRHAESLGEHATASADRSAMARCDRAYCDLVERIRNALGAADAEAVRLVAEVDSAHATGVVHGHATATARLRAEVERAREERDAALTTVAGTEARALAAERARDEARSALMGALEWARAGDYRRIPHELEADIRRALAASTGEADRG